MLARWRFVPHVNMLCWYVHSSVYAVCFANIWDCSERHVCKYYCRILTNKLKYLGNLFLLWIIIVNSVFFFSLFPFFFVFLTLFFLHFFFFPLFFVFFFKIIFVNFIFLILNWLNISLCNFFPLKYYGLLRCFPIWFFYFIFYFFKIIFVDFIFLILSWLRI